MKEDKKETKEQENKKNIKGILISIVIMIVVILVAVITSKILATDSPTKALETMLNDLKAGNYNQEILSNSLDEENFSKEAQKLMFDKLEWKVQKVTQEKETATLELEITNKDFKTIMSNYMQKAIKAAFSEQNITEEQMSNYLIEELNNSEIPMVTSNQTIMLQKKDGKWESTQENDFISILLPGFNEAMDALN